MITIGVTEINGVLTPDLPIGNAPFGKLFDGTNWLIFESQEEANQHAVVFPDIEESNTADSTVLGLVTKMSPEAIAELKELLK